MARVKGGPQGHHRHKKVLKMTKGQYGSRSKLFKRANRGDVEEPVVRLPRSPQHSQTRPAPVVDHPH